MVAKGKSAILDVTCETQPIYSWNSSFPVGMASTRESIKWTVSGEYLYADGKLVDMQRFPR